MYAIKEAVIAKEHSKEPLDAAIFYMDMRTYGKDSRSTTTVPRKKRGFASSGPEFIPSNRRKRESEDTLCHRIRDVKEEDFDMVVLSIGLAPVQGVTDLAKKLGVALNEHQYAMTSSFAPVTTSRDGIYVCGVSSPQKDIPHSVMEASASAAASTEVLATAREPWPDPSSCLRNSMCPARCPGSAFLCAIAESTSAALPMSRP